MEKQFKLMLGNNIESLKKLPDNSIDSIVSDPPYGLSFMGKKWDYDVPSVEFWKEVYRVLKPGGHVLSFGGTRTYHRMVVNIEDAGFEIRDQIMWIYGSGFPKSLNVGKAVDKLQGNKREVVGLQTHLATTSGDSLQFGSTLKKDKANSIDITKGTSPWEGWGTTLKPANEPICVARKPLSEKSVAENVLKWKTGGINVDGCRVGSDGGTMKSGDIKPNIDPSSINIGIGDIINIDAGRFPSNLILDEEAARMLDEQSGVLSKQSKSKRKGGFKTEYVGGENINKYETLAYNDAGGASRFFYQAKVSKKERNMGLDGFEERTSMKWNGSDGHKGIGDFYPDGSERPKTVHKNVHPTVKPVQLMAYLCRLVTPPNGIVLDPFMGSGSTGIAAQLEGFRFVGMEMDEDYFKIAEARIENYEKYREFLKNK